MEAVFIFIGWLVFTLLTFAASVVMLMICQFLIYDENFDIRNYILYPVYFLGFLLIVIKFGWLLAYMF
jgi:hypothetical protein